MFENFGSILRERCNLNAQKPVLVGVSGGPDSLCLMHLLHEAGLRIIVAHFNHGLRSEADADAKAVADTAARLAVPFVVEIADVRLHASEERLSIEEAARTLRYRFLLKQARRYQAQAVAVGHTADDQVETVLMHFIRGAGLNGLRGMAYRTILTAFDAEIPIVRPLLDTWRVQVAAYCTAHGLRPRHDASNDSLDFLRNRIRNELIPNLESYNPRFREAVWRSAHTLTSDYALLTEGLESAWKQSVIEETADFVELDLKILSKLAPEQQRHLVRRAVLRLDSEQETVYSVLERAADFIANSDRRRMDLIGGFTLSREGSLLYIARPNAEIPSVQWPQMPAGMDAISISVPGEEALARGWRFASERCLFSEAAFDECLRNQDQFQAWLDADSLPARLELRVRRRGDAIAPLGLEGHSQKLSDLFMNAKLPQRARDRWPVLCCEETVIWVPGFRPSERFKLTKATQTVVHLAVRPAHQIP